jgi:hypothetical protein
MTLIVDLSEEIRAKLDAKARAAGLDVPTYAQRVLQAEALLPSPDETLRPVREAFKKTGMTPNQLGDQYEEEKHADRAARRGKRFSE